MKRLITAGAVTLALFLGVPVAAPDLAQTAAAATYKNCTQLNKKYPGGVAKSSKAKNTKISHGKKVKAKSKYKPKASASLYKKYKKMDRDKDGIACER